MIPKILDWRRGELLARSEFENVRAALAVAFLNLLLFSAVAGRASSLPQSQDPDSKPASSAAPKQSTEASPLKKAVREKKVITDEDLAKPEKPLNLNEGDDEENNSICDLSCEAELKSQMGIGRERELEFRNQLTLARNEIGNDRSWNSDLDGAFRAASSYCDVQRQKAEMLSKGNVNDYTRYMANSRFAKQESDLSVQYRNYAGLAKQHIEAVQRFAPFRATIMQYQWNDLTNRACPDFRFP